MGHASYVYDVELSDVDFTRRLRLSRLLDFVLSAAGSNASANGFGVEDLLKRGRTWVLSRVGVELAVQPVLGDRVRVETWIEDCGELTTTRNFVISSGDGKQIGVATSQWAVIDVVTRRAVEIGDDYARFATGEGSLCGRVRRVLPLNGEVVDVHKVVYSDTDINGHTNSVRYVDLMLNTIPNAEEFFARSSVKRFDVAYMSESRIGDVLSVYNEARDGGKWLFDVKNEGGGSVCRMCLEVN